MYRIEIGKGIYTYLVGNHTVAIITPSRKKHIAYLHAVRDEKLSENRIQNGTADGRIAPEEIVAYVLKLDLK